MSDAALDALTSPTLKNLREYWWNDEFTAFLRSEVEKWTPVIKTFAASK